MTVHYLNKGDFIKTDKKWLIIDITDGFCLLILCETTKMKFLQIEESKLLKLIEEEKADLIEKKPSKVIENVEFGSTAILNKRMRDMANDILHYDKNLFWLNERNRRAVFIKDTAIKYKTSTDTVRRFLRDYLQNNISLRGLSCRYHRCGGRGKEKTYKNGKRPGRKSGISRVERSEEVIVQFEAMKERYLAARTRMSFTSLYMTLCEEYYSVQKVVGGETFYDYLAASERPTKTQLYYYIKTHLSDTEKYIANHGARKAQNNIRPLHSDTIAKLDMKSIGAIFEMDETETDFYLVDRYDRNKVIGRAIVYFIVDVFSKLIAGFSVGLDNNSWAGAEIALLNMVEDKVEICRRAGIDITEKEWPVNGVMPTAIQVDNGSEYVSYDFERFGIENGIKLYFVPTQMGSFKPNVEQKFRQFHLQMKGLIPGEIIKDDYGQPHVRKACLTIEDFYKLVIQFVLSYNKTPMLNYKADKDIYSSGIIPSPINIWNYKLDKENALRKVVDMEQYKYNLLSEGNASITREGIKFKKAIYTCEDQEWLCREMTNVKFEGKKKLTVRYDKRNMDFIYFQLDGEIVKGWLSDMHTVNEKYRGLAYEEFLSIHEKEREMAQICEEERLKEQTNLQRRVKEVVKAAKKKHKGKNETKDIERNRKIEKERLHKEAQIIIGTEKKQIVEIPDLNQSQGKGRAPSLIKLEGIDRKSLTTEELFQLQDDIKYEIDVLGYSR